MMDTLIKVTIVFLAGLALINILLATFGDESKMTDCYLKAIINILIWILLLEVMR
jgi:hypothetical protein